MAKDDRPVLVYTTFASLDEVGDALVAALAACVNIFPGMISIYEWKGARELADEVAMIMTRASLSPIPCWQYQAPPPLRAAGTSRAAERKGAAKIFAAGF